MKIKKDRLIQIIKEELDDYQVSMAQDDPEEFMSNMRSQGSIAEIDKEISRLRSEISELLKQRENLLMNIDSGDVTFQQSIERGSNE